MGASLLALAKNMNINMSKHITVNTLEILWFIAFIAKQ